MSRGVARSAYRELHAQAIAHGWRVELAALGATNRRRLVSLTVWISPDPADAVVESLATDDNLERAAERLLARIAEVRS